MKTPEVWTYYRRWTRIPLQTNVKFVNDLRKAIGETMRDAFGINQPYAFLTLKAVKDYRKEDHEALEKGATELTGDDSLASVLETLSVDGAESLGKTDYDAARNSFAEKIRLFVELPVTRRPYPPSAPAQGSSKQTVQNAFPNGLPYRTPKRSTLLFTSGLEWDYQPAKDLNDTLSNELNLYYEHYSKVANGEQIDKTYAPIFFFLAGAGTGKSRNAVEFHGTATGCLTNGILKERIKDAWVFHVSLSNGTAWTDGEGPHGINAIGTRMLCQLLNHENGNLCNTFYETLANYVPPNPLDVVQLLAKNTRKELKDCTVVLVVDSIHSFIDSAVGYSVLQDTLSSIGNLNNTGPFWISCCTATVTKPITTFMGQTHRKRVVLPVAYMEPPTIMSQQTFPIDNPIIELLVSDCGGHGRALEALYEVINNAIRGQGDDRLKNIRNYISSCNINTLMDSLYMTLIDRYSEAIGRLRTSDVEAISRAILTNQLLDADQPISNTTTTTPEEINQSGLIRFDIIAGTSSGYLTAPYVWIWMLSRGGEDSLLGQWHFSDYNYDYNYLRPDTVDSDPLGWLSFERFVARFRCLKSQVFGKGSLITIGEMHQGADLHPEARTILFKNRPLSLVAADKSVQTKSTEVNLSTWPVLCQSKFVDIREGKHCVINAYGAEAGDSFVSLGRWNEVHQDKYYSQKTALNQKMFDAERQKAASTSDFFILYTTKSIDSITPSPRSGIVHAKNWKKYFGPYASRAFIFASTGRIDINQATEKQLMQLKGVDPEKAKEIMQKRPISLEETNPLVKRLKLDDDESRRLYVERQ